MSEFKRVLLEGVVVALAGTLLGFAANAVNPQGLVLSRDYFFERFERSSPITHATLPADTATAPGGQTNLGPDASARQENDSQGDSGVGPLATGQVGSEEPTEQEIIQALWNEEGLQGLKHTEVAQAFEDPLHEADVFIFIDAREDKQYAEGHIPRAFHLDPYRSERYLETVLVGCQQAQKIIVYCNGGKCEDSVYAAKTLLEKGVDWSQLFVYAGGFEAWKADQRPIETGQRLSGKIGKGGGHE